VDGENSLDAKYTPELGVNMDKLIVIQLDEYAGEGAYDKMQTLVESGEIDLVVIDSYNALQPKKIVDEGLDQQTMGLHARMLGRVVMKANQYCKSYGTTFIFIGQLREKIGVMFGSPETTQGGNALRFYAHMRVDVSRSTTADNSIVEGDEKTGNLHKIHIKKNKMAAPFKKAEFYIRYGKGIDKYMEILELAHEYEVGKKYGKSYTYDSIKYDMEEFTQMLRDNE
jgi:recombination protein RecA